MFSSGFRTFILEKVYIIHPMLVTLLFSLSLFSERTTLFMAVLSFFACIVLVFVAVFFKYNSLNNPRGLIVVSMSTYATIILLFAEIYSYNGLINGTVIDAQSNEEVLNITNSKKDALYFSIVTWTTLGYGDLQPTQNVKFLAAFQALLGMYSTALLFGLFIYSLGLKNKRDS